MTNKSGWAIWFVGLPGAGKSSLAEAVHQSLQERGYEVELLQMDERRDHYRSKSKEEPYSPKEREKAYAMFVDEAAFHVVGGRGVLMDATAYKLDFRTKARHLIPKFAEVYVKCDLETAVQRETAREDAPVMAELYKKALERQKTGETMEGLGDVVGVDVPFEDDPFAELVVDVTDKSVDEARDCVLNFLNEWLPE